MRTTRVCIFLTLWVGSLLSALGCQSQEPFASGLDDVGVSDKDGDGDEGKEDVGDLEPGSPDDGNGGVVSGGAATPDDMDADGLEDDWEKEHGLAAKGTDEDEDGVSDFVEVVAGTDPTAAASNPAAEGNFYFVVPYEEDPTPDKDDLAFATKLTKADVFILMDTTSSMSGAINKLKATLSGTIIPKATEAIPDLAFGVGRFDDYPVKPYGTPGTDVVFRRVQKVTGDSSLAQKAVGSLFVHSGEDGSESYVPALWATATGKGLGKFLGPADGCDDGQVGYPCFRGDAARVVILVGDSTFHNGPGGADPYSGITPAPPKYAETVAALKDIHAKVVGVYVDYTKGAFPIDIDMGAKAHFEAIAKDTGAVDVDGKPLIFPVGPMGFGLDDSIVEALEMLASAVPMAMTARAKDEGGDDVDATELIERIEPSDGSGKKGEVCLSGLDRTDEDKDGALDTFPKVPGGTSVCFDIFPARNTIVPPADKPQVFTANIEVLGDGVTVLDSRKVFFLVPPSHAIAPI